MEKSQKHCRRFNGPSYQELLDLEKRPVPDALRSVANVELGNAPIDTSRYLSRAFYALEKQRLWPRVWQALCRETELAEPGDYYVQDIADVSVLLVRTREGALRAFPNACLHRGRQLKGGGAGGFGKSADLTCPFHGFSWELDGRFRGAPCQWDFPHIRPGDFSTAGPATCHLGRLGSS